MSHADTQNTIAHYLNHCGAPLDSGREQPEYLGLSLRKRLELLQRSPALAADWARRRTSTATTAKPLPASPARAASMVAFRASRLVWLAMELMSCTTSPMRAADSGLLRG